VLAIRLDQCPGDGVTERSSLTGLATTTHMGLHIEGAESIGGGEGLLNVLNQGRAREIVTQGPAIDVPLAGTWREIHAGHAGLAPAYRLPTEFGCRRHALAFEGVMENGLGC
jgi:hypothetical protein